MEEEEVMPEKLHLFDRFRLRHRLHREVLEAHNLAHDELSIWRQGFSWFSLVGRRKVILVDTPLAAQHFRLFEALDLARESVRSHLDSSLQLEAALFGAEKGSGRADSDLDDEATLVALRLAPDVDDRVVGHGEVAG